VRPAGATMPAQASASSPSAPRWRRPQRSPRRPGSRPSRPHSMRCPRRLPIVEPACLGLTCLPAAEPLLAVEARVPAPFAAEPDRLPPRHSAQEQLDNMRLVS
jgi:hypothetical protein